MAKGTDSNPSWLWCVASKVWSGVACVASEVWSGVGCVPNGVCARACVCAAHGDVLQSECAVHPRSPRTETSASVKTARPNDSKPEAKNSSTVYCLRWITMPPSITGMSLHDLKTTWDGYDKYLCRFDCTFGCVSIVCRVALLDHPSKGKKVVDNSQKRRAQTVASESKGAQ